MRSLPQPEVSILARRVRPWNFLLMQEGPFLIYQLISLPPHPRGRALVEKSGCQGTGGEVWGDLGETRGCEWKHQGCRRLLSPESHKWWLAGPSLSSSCSEKSG